jgi:Fic family protein
MKINLRQQQILSHLKGTGSFVKASDLQKKLQVSKRTVIRDVQNLVDLGLLEEVGGGRSTTYQLSNTFEKKKEIDVAEYFSKSSTSRNAKAWFDEEVFDLLSDNIFTMEDKMRLEDLAHMCREAKNKLQNESPTILRRELERLVIELSWKSSQIEGNTYSLLETEALIKDHQLAYGKDKAEAKMILNHKKALDYIFQNPDYLQKITVSKIIYIHGILVDDLDIHHGFRNHPVGIIPILNQKST